MVCKLLLERSDADGLGGCAHRLRLRGSLVALQADEAIQTAVKPAPMMRMMGTWKDEEWSCGAA